MLRMLERSRPFAIEAPLSSRLDGLQRYWKSLLRGKATVPLVDDIDMTKVRSKCPDVLVLGVFERPWRFRLDLVHTPSAPEAERKLAGRFVHEVDLPTPLQHLRAQAGATVEHLAPTLYDHAPAAQRGYARLLLPAWGEGQVRLLLGGVAWR